MGYCIMVLNKLKTPKDLAYSYRHNYRMVTVLNADPKLKEKNEELVKLPPDAHEEGYYKVFKDRIRSLPYYQTHKVRKNAVRALESVTTYTREGHEDMDLERWKAKNVQWLHDTFDVAPDGKSNVISVMYHADEPGNVHCHSILIPIDENGHLNSTRFTGGRQKMIALQDSYAESMKEFGLDRGLSGSSAKHEDIKKFSTCADEILCIGI